MAIIFASARRRSARCTLRLGRRERAGIAANLQLVRAKKEKTNSRKSRSGANVRWKMRRASESKPSSEKTHYRIHLIMQRHENSLAFSLDGDASGERTGEREEIIEPVTIQWASMSFPFQTLNFTFVRADIRFCLRVPPNSTSERAPEKQILFTIQNERTNTENSLRTIRVRGAQTKALQDQILFTRIIKNAAENENNVQTRSRAPLREQSPDIIIYLLAAGWIRLSSE